MSCPSSCACYFKKPMNPDEYREFLVKRKIMKKMKKELKEVVLKSRKRRR